jgi:hypothetical protein
VVGVIAVLASLVFEADVEDVEERSHPASPQPSPTTTSPTTANRFKAALFSIVARAPPPGPRSINESVDSFLHAPR